MKLALCAVIVIACGGKEPDPHKHIDDNRPRLLELKKQLAALPLRLQDAPVPEQNQMDFDPPLYFHREYKQSDDPKQYNLQVFEIGQLEHPEESEYDARWPHEIIGRACALEAKPPDKAKAKGKGTQMSFKHAFDAAWAIRYVAVVNIYEWIPPKITASANPILAGSGAPAAQYTPGVMKARVHIVDLQTDKIVYGFETSAETPESVKFAYDWTKPDTAGAAASAAVSGQLRGDLETRIRRRLEILGDIRL